MTIQNLVRIETHHNRVIDLMQVEGEYRIDSRQVATGLDIQHQTFLETLYNYQTQLEHFGLLRFETDAVKTEGSRGTKYTKFALLNRNQVLFAITLSRNTEAVIEWKLALIDALDQLEKQVGQLPRLAKTKSVPASEEEVRVKIAKRVLAFLERQEEPVSRRTITKYGHSCVAIIEPILDELVASGKVSRITIPGSRVQWFYQLLTDNQEKV